MSDVREDDGPILLRVAVLLLWIEAAGLTVLAAVEFLKIPTSSPEDPGAAALLGVMILVGAYTALKAGLALQRRHAWGVAAGMVLQAGALPVAYFMLTGDASILTRIGGVSIAALCLTCLACLAVHTWSEDSILAARRVSSATRKGHSSAGKH